jgi:type I restriction enzyme, S subunit
MSEDLPQGWLEAPLADVCEPVSQRGPSRERETFRYVDLSALDNKAKRIAQANSVPISDAPSRAKQVIAKGDVLFSTVRVYLENIAQVPEELDGEIASTAFCVLRPSKGLDPKYLYYFVTSRHFVQAVNALQRGNSPPSVQEGDVRGQRTPLAPLPEQRRIASRIEELFSEIEAGERALERVQKLVGRYRQSVLKAAVTGELTQRRSAVESPERRLADILEARGQLWREDGQSGRYPEPTSLSSSLDLPTLPVGWLWASMDQIGLVSGGVTKNRGRAERELQRPYLRVANVYANRLSLDEVHEIGVSTAELPRITLKTGDLLVVEGNGSVDQIGRVALWDGSIPGCVHQNHIIKVRCTAPLPAWFVLVWCLSPMGRQYIERVASSSSGLHTLSISKIQSLPVPVPPAGDLERIRNEFERMDVATASVLAAVGGESRRASALRQAVLKAAFSGQLVPQDPNDEPASALLTRLAAQATEAPAKPRPRSRKIAA